MVEAYDPETDTWERKADMPAGRTAPASVLGGSIYVFGGAAAGGAMARSSLFEYNPLADSWKRLDDMPFQRLAMSTSVVNGKVYLIGGSATRFPHRPYLVDVIEYSPEQ
jgi:N-acetylneuraminic acid mutarotase